MDQQERHYNINKLNLIFAISSVVLLLSLGLMLKDDYSREWKNYQAEFKTLEIEKTRVKYDAETNELQKNAEYQELLDQITKAREAFDAKCSDLQDVEKSIKTLQAENDLIKHRFKIEKAKQDAARFRYEEAVDKKHSVVGSKRKYDELAAQVNELKLEAENSDKALNDKTKIIEECGRELGSLQKKEKDFAGKANIIKRKLQKIDPNEMGPANLAAGLVRDLPIIDLSSPKYKIEQVVLKDITDDVKFMRVPKVDRCITCHMGISNPDYKNAPQPFTTHPNLEVYVGNDSPHPLEEFGCTVCHGGRGRGTDFVSTAHTPSSHAQEEEWKKKYHWHEMHHWEDPMYPKQYVEAGCFKCHAGESEIKGAEKLNLGLQLIERSGCFACHKIEKYEGWIEPGPDLTKISSKISKDWAYRWINNPQSFRHNTWMPSFFNQSNSSDPQSLERTQQEIHAVVHYLFENSKDYEVASMPHWGNPEQGEKIVSSLGCFGCHNIKQEPSNTPTTRDSLRREQGPNLIGLGTKTSKVWLYNWLKDPHRYHPDTRMPNLRLTDQEAADAAAFLAQDTNEEFMQQPVPPVNENVLDEIARTFLSKTNTSAQVKAELAKMDLNEKLLYVGKKTIAHYGCFSCHDIKGFADYKPIGTELTEEGSKAVDKLDFGFIDIPHTRQAWFTQKLQNPRIFDRDKVKAPDEKLRMPNYYFSDEEVEAIVTALLGFVKDKPAASKMKLRTARNDYIEEGQKIVRQFNCQGCHIIEGVGGTIQPTITDWLVKYDNRGQAEAEALTASFAPPNLIGEGKKVQSEWLFNFLHQPEDIRPWLSVRMPTYKFNVAHLNALVKYFNALDNQEFPFSDVGGQPLTPEEYAAGEKLFSDDYFACAKCHIVGDQFPAGSPDSWAPNFALANERLKPDWLIEWLKNPQDLLPGTKMPTFYDPEYFDESGPPDILDGDENKQIEILTRYLMTLSDEPKSAASESQKK